jgi:anthranilate synthase/aminodeoxychorismate synthase-like glutamine amidotransferase
MILLVDNRDSFVHNLARYLELLGQPTKVVRNDAIDVAGVRSIAPDAVVFSPGPCTPREAGASLEIARSLHRELPMLGVCLGHQVIAESLGGRVVRARRPRHGQASAVEHIGDGIFAGIPSPFQAGRYHSLVVEPASLPACLRPTAWSDEGELMAFQHVSLPVFGVQFHPESILTEHGLVLLANFLGLARFNAISDDAVLPPSELPQPSLVNAI